MHKQNRTQNDEKFDVGIGFMKDRILGQHFFDKNSDSAVWMRNNISNCFESCWKNAIRTSVIITKIENYYWLKVSRY